MKKYIYTLSFTLLFCLLAIQCLPVKSYCLPPPCEFYPDFAYQGEVITVYMPLFCGVEVGEDKLPNINFDVPGIEVVSVHLNSYQDYSVTISISSATPPGAYAPAITVGEDVIMTQEEAANYWLIFSVLPSPEGTSPCIIYPDSVYPGENVNVDLYLLCSPITTLDILPNVIFDGAGIEVTEINKKTQGVFSVNLNTAFDVLPGNYSPYVIMGNEVYLSPDEAQTQGLILNVQKMPPQLALYPTGYQRKGTSALYLIKGINTNFKNGISFVSSDEVGIFAIFQFVFSPTDFMVMLQVMHDVVPGSYKLTVVTEDERITAENILTVTD